MSIRTDYLDGRTARQASRTVRQLRCRARSVLAVAPAIETTTEQSLNNSLPNTSEQQVLIRATGTKNRESEHLRYAVNRRVAGSNPA